jgi:hypothetical protein
VAVLVGVALLAVVGWVVLTRDKGTEAQAQPPAGPSTSTSTPSRTSQPAATSSGPSPTPSPTPRATTPQQPAGPTTPPPTTKRTPGPGEVEIPDVSTKQPMEANYLLGVAQLNSQFAYVADPGKCVVKETSPPIGSIVPIHSMVTIIVDGNNGCQTV